uniref:Uncharacterized protein n=1 Tax=Meloidogyne enterolobii TaxID=390850 RepID=A0A6V7TWV7_MELEN|nr:unnamed protein product [Meloidogyne enterolobii]
MMSSKRRRVIRTIFPFIILLVSTLIIFNTLLFKNNEDIGEQNLKLFEIEKDVKFKWKKGEIVKNIGEEQQACKIPKLEVNGSEVIKFYKNILHWIVLKGSLNLGFILMRKGDKIGLHNINCNWAFYSRKTDSELVWTEEEIIRFGAKIEKGDYVKISCMAGSRQWSNPFMVVVPKNKEKKKKDPNEATKLLQNSSDPINVYILSFDSLSQMSFRRNLPKTVKFLEENDFAVFNGYNIVGDGTPQAFIPILTGFTEEELPLTRKRYSSAHYVDEVYPFVWNNFSNAGYATMYGEDGHSFGTFTYRLKGFRNSPTHHYPITFFHYAETLDNSRVCIGAEKQHNVWFRYIESFWNEYSKLQIPRFLLMHHSYLSHDDINKVQQADDDLFVHLQKMEKMGAFDNSLFIVMADHGNRFAKLRETHQGQLEERLPFFSVHFPQKYKQVWSNIKLNSVDRLVTPFDFHATLMDIFRWPKLGNDYFSNKLMTSTSKDFQFPMNRAISFLREIPLERTCKQAGIETHWCTCLNWIIINNVDEVTPLANSVIDKINKYTESERSLCSKLELKNVESAKKLVPNEKLLKYNGVVDFDGFKPQLKGNVKTKFATYQIVFITTPGAAKYEVTLFYDGNQIKVDLSAISHINKYGDTPHCIIEKNYFMATWCVCYDRI